MPRLATGDIGIDAALPPVVQAEERVLKWLRTEYGREVVDYRTRRRGYDFLVSRAGDRTARKVDVKADFQATTTGRIAWEAVVLSPSGLRRPGWGQYALDWVFVVLPAGRGDPWPALVLDAQLWRVFVTEAVFTRQTEGWHRFDMANKDGSRGQGWAIPLAALRAADRLIVREIVV